MVGLQQKIVMDECVKIIDFCTLVLESFQDNIVQRQPYCKYTIALTIEPLISWVVVESFEMNTL